MKCLSLHENLPHGQVIYLDRVIIHYKTNKFVDINSPLTEHNSPKSSYPNPPEYATKLTVQVRYTNTVILPCIQKM